VKGVAKAWERSSKQRGIARSRDFGATTFKPPARRGGLFVRTNDADVKMRLPSRSEAQIEWTGSR
jgi:hypothetical protein